MRTVAEQPDQHGASDEQLPGFADRRNRETECGHPGAKCRDHPHPDAICEAAHHDAAEAGAQPH
jgi:hypothetical protein